MAGTIGLMLFLVIIAASIEEEWFKKNGEEFLKDEKEQANTK